LVSVKLKTREKGGDKPKVEHSPLGITTEVKYVVICCTVSDTNAKYVPCA